jgi:hypothetical protein
MALQWYVKTFLNIDKLLRYCHIAIRYKMQKIECSA